MPWVGAIFGTGRVGVDAGSNWVAMLRQFQP